METKSLTFKVDGKSVKVNYEEISPGRANLPSYKPLPKSVPNDFSKYSNWADRLDELEFSHSITVAELKEDIASLMPKTLEEPEKHIQSQFATTLKNHVKKYGRLLDDDLVTYIDETILVMKSIDKAIGREPFDENEAKRIFNALYSAVSIKKT
jgi:hypothetical protein